MHTKESYLLADQELDAVVGGMMDTGVGQKTYALPRNSGGNANQPSLGEFLADGALAIGLVLAVTA
ncbi:MAG TPA: hypothetical protein VIH58_13000 [Chthoniobacterales bacterium]|jgi:hypothetical protein